MKKNRLEKNKSNISSLNHSYCIVLGNAGERTAGMDYGKAIESGNAPKKYWRRYFW